MATSISTIRGISSDTVSKMNAKGIKNTDDLLEAASTPKGRSDLAKEVGLEPSALTELLNRADLARISGIGDAFANLLEDAGVDTVKELSHRKPENLHTALVELNTAKKIAHHVPGLDVIEGWVAEAKTLSSGK
jgi:predicted flap endonuclease-1-like 5' DNA nuclease